MKLKMSHKIAIAAVVVIAGIVVVYSSLNSAQALNLSASDGVLVPASLISRLNVPNNVGSAVGIGLGKPLQKINGSSLELNGKPEILYIGAEFCPYCAAERWPMIIALMRFGNFTGIRYMTSSAADPVDPGTPTFTFANATYNSRYISFVGIETLGNKLVNGNYQTLETLNSSEAAINSQYNPQGDIPFIDLANKSLGIGASYDPAALSGKNWSQITASLYNTSSLQAESIIGNANIFTAEICSIDNNTPQSVCGQSYIARIESSTG